jgi:rubrerythrin
MLWQPGCDEHRFFEHRKNQQKETGKMKQSTAENLKQAFAGESQAYMKYSIFADKAEREGFPEVARLFRAIAFAEQVHATNHLRQLGGINDTAANLEQAMAGEDYEVTEMYPAFSAVAELQDEKGALRSMHYALEAEKIHEVLYSDAKGAVEEGQDIASASVFVCPVCGHTAIGEAPEKCPVCGLPRNRFKEF